MQLVGATLTIAYIGPTQMNTMAVCGARQAPFLSHLCACLTAWHAPSIVPVVRNHVPSGV